jgi:putative peptidoglycan lipid II flippase
VLAIFLMWANSHFAWVALRTESFKRIWLLGLMLLASVAIYFIVLWVTGLKFRALLQHGSLSEK